MVERIWSAHAATRESGEGYAAYFHRVVLPELRAVPGFCGARLLQRDLRGTIEIVVSTRWESMDVIRGFAGDNIDEAVVHAEAAAFFSDYEHTVRHFEVVSEDPA
jgi:heme-degrading monooxygenase HmoA